MYVQVGLNKPLLIIKELVPFRRNPRYGIVALKTELRSSPVLEIHTLPGLLKHQLSLKG